MIRLACLVGVIHYSPGVLGLSVVCPDKSFPREVQDEIAIERDSSKQRESFTFLLPETYGQERLESAELQVRDAHGALVRVPLAVAKTEVPAWWKKLVAFVHATNSKFPLAVEARYGFPCTWVLTGSVAP